MWILPILIAYTLSQCPRYSIVSNPGKLVESRSFMAMYYNGKEIKLSWPDNITVKCSQSVLTSSSKSWSNTLPTTYINDAAVIDLSTVKPFAPNERPQCVMYTNNNPCFNEAPYPIYFPELTFLYSYQQKIDVCLDDYFALRVFTVSESAAPFVYWRSAEVWCDVGFEARLIYDTLYIGKFGKTDYNMICKIFSHNVVFSLNYVSSSPNCMGPTNRIMYPKENDVIYYYQYSYNNYDFINQIPNIPDICLPIRSDIIMYDSTGQPVIHFDQYQGRQEFSCEFKGNPSSKIKFTMVFPRPPKITKPLSDCSKCKANCVLSFDYDPGVEVPSITVTWYLNGRKIQDGYLFKFSSDKKTLNFTPSNSLNGNVQVIIDSTFGTQMTSSYVEYVEPPFFSLDLPRYGVGSESGATLNATVNFLGKGDVKMWWIMDGNVLSKPVKNVIATVDVATYTCTLRFLFDANDPITGTFSCVFQSDGCIVESTKYDFSMTQKIRDTVSLMTPVFGVLGAAILLALVLIPLCVLYRNRHSKAYRLALVERECGLNPDKDFLTLNDFGENSRRQARNNPTYSVLPGGGGSNDGSVLPFNNMPDIREQASFINDYQP